MRRDHNWSIMPFIPPIIVFAVIVVVVVSIRGCCKGVQNQEISVSQYWEVRDWAKEYPVLKQKIGEAYEDGKIVRWEYREIQQAQQDAFVASVREDTKREILEQ